jgi:adenine deaminase
MKRLVGITACSMLLLMSAGASPALDPRLAYGSADLVLMDGKVITVDSLDTVEQAVAMKEGHIIAVGTSEEVQRLVGPQTEIMRLDGKSVLPGLIDAHTHWRGSRRFIECWTFTCRPLKESMTSCGK